MIINNISQSFVIHVINKFLKFFNYFQMPWFKNFLGTIDDLDYHRYMISGEIGKTAHNKYEITELPVRTWTQAYKESVLEPLYQGSEKIAALIR